MIASEFPELGAEDLAAQVRASAEEYRAVQTAAGGCESRPTTWAESGQQVSDEQRFLPPLVLQPDFRLNANGRYHVNELLAFHDRHFVHNAFQALHGRAPAPVELDEYLMALRGGRLTKQDILETLRAAAGREGREVRVQGFARRGFKGLARRLQRAPIAGRLLRVLRALWRVPLLMEHQQRFEAYALGQQQEIVSYLNSALGQQRTEIENLSHLIGDMSAMTAQTAAVLAHLSTDIAGVSDRMAQTSADISGLSDDLANASESIVMLADVLAGIAAHIPELAVPERLLRKQAEIETLAQSLSEAQEKAAAANRELIVQEQFFIVEAQKAALAELERRLDELHEQHERLAAARS